MAKYAKCQICKKKNDTENMTIEEKISIVKKTGKQNITRKYYCKGNCYEFYLEDRKRKEIERDTFDFLYNTILKIHNVDVLCGRSLKKIQDFRNGTVDQKGIKIKKYKEGIPYDIISEGYKRKINTIENILKTKDFQTKYHEFSYCFSIATSIVNDILTELKNKEKQEDNIKKVENTEENKIEFSTQRGKKDNLNISDIL